MIFTRDLNKLKERKFYDAHDDSILFRNAFARYCAIYFVEITIRDTYTFKYKILENYSNCKEQGKYHLLDTMECLLNYEFQDIGYYVYILISSHALIESCLIFRIIEFYPLLLFLFYYDILRIVEPRLIWSKLFQVLV